MTFAAFSTIIAVFENIISCVRDLTGWSRRKACIIGCISLFILCLPCALGFSVLSFIQPMGEGSVIMDIEDYIVSYLMLPLGSLAFVIFCTARYGWGWKNFMEEANTGKGLKIKNWMRIYMTYILPLLVIGVFAINVIF